VCLLVSVHFSSFSFCLYRWLTTKIRWKYELLLRCGDRILLR
jgi:hypothetical protein